MIKSITNSSYLTKVFTIFPLCCLLSVFLFSAPVFSADKIASAGETARIQITSDRMKAVSRDGYAEFIGNVKAVQGKFSITSDVLRIYYNDTDSKADNPVKKGSISKIVAKGNVHIKAEEFSAVSDLALYLTEKKIVILQGPHSKVSSGENFIVGSRITYNRSDGSIKVEGSNNNRVQGVFYSGKNEKVNFPVSSQPEEKEETSLPPESKTPVEEKEIKD